MSLHDDVRAYYWQHFSDLPHAEQLHYAGRLAMWEHDSQALDMLQTLRPLIVPSPVNDESLHRELVAITSQPLRQSMPAFALRKPYFEKYPTLYGWHEALFRVRHLEVLYGISARQAFLALAPQAELEQLAADLWKDTEALVVLSTLAVNYLYLFQRYIMQKPQEINVKRLYDLREKYDQNDPEQLRLLLYLLTHCVIAASNFYATSLPAEQLANYQEIVRYLQTVIESHFDQLSLDTKLEFLVCCRIASYDSSLKERIYDECQQSVSPDGTFLIDTLNHFAKLHIKHDFAQSEHRNVLFILSASAFKPSY